MALVIIDSKIVTGERNNFTGVYFKAFEEFQATYSLDMNIEYLGQVLIYSASKELETAKAKIASVDKLAIRDNGMTFYFNNLEDANVTCGDVKRNLYFYAKKNDLLKDGRTRICYVINDKKEFNILTNKYEALMANIDRLFSKNEWDKIIELFGDLNSISKTEYWDHYSLLSKLSFALSKKVLSQEIYHNKYDEYFIDILNRTLELKPDCNKTKSTKAYYYYQKYIDFKKQCDYDKAYAIYYNFVKEANEKFKENYRFNNLKQTYLDNHKYKMSLKEINKPYLTIRDEYQNLINQYQGLSEEEQKRNKKNYLKCLYSYCSIELDNFLNYWDEYVRNKLFGKSYWSFMFEEKQKNRLDLVEEYLLRLINDEYFEQANIDNIKDNPGYFHIVYRLSQAKQQKAIFNIVTSKNYTDLLKESNELIKKSFGIADEYRKDKENKFNYPSFMRKIKAINYYLLGEYEEAHRTYSGSRLRTYEIYENALLFALHGDAKNALDTLRFIPKPDLCRKKADFLMEYIIDNFN